MKKKLAQESRKSPVIGPERPNIIFATEKVKKKIKRKLTHRGSKLELSEWLA